MGEKLIQSVLRAVEILEFVSECKDGISLKDLAKKMNLGAPTVYHLTNTLKFANLVKQNKDKKYKLGPKNLQIGNAYLENLSFYQISLPVMQDLRDKIKENVYLTMLDNLNFVTIIRLQGTQLVRSINDYYEKANAHSTAIGKVLLSSLRKEKLYEFFENKNLLEKFTKNTIFNIEDLQKELKIVRNNQYALDLEESDYGINCIGVPIFNQKNEIKAALGTSIPSQRFSDKLKDSILLQLQDAALIISLELGYKK